MYAKRGSNASIFVPKKSSSFLKRRPAPRISPPYDCDEQYETPPLKSNTSGITAKKNQSPSSYTQCAKNAGLSPESLRSEKIFLFDCPIMQSFHPTMPIIA
jgi:hypothetical protein